MAYFHVTAVFETRGASQEEADRTAAAVLASVRHPRVHLYEHDTNGGLGPFPPGKSLYFTTIAEFDVEASREEQAGEIADEILDTLSTEAAQYLGLGIMPGSQRVSPEQRHAPEEELPEESEAQAEQEEDDPEGKGRRPRGRRRKRGPEREARPREERPHEEEISAPARILPPATPTGVEVVTLAPSPLPPSTPPASPSLRAEQPQTVSISELIVDTPPLPPPPRSSASMRVTLTVNIRASELARSEERTLDHSELLALACEEARRRHPELPADVVPESATSSLPAGDTLLLLTWHFDRPIPSALEAAD